MLEYKPNKLKKIINLCYIKIKFINNEVYISIITLKYLPIVYKCQ